MHLLLRDYLTNEKNKASVNERSGQGCAGSAPERTGVRQLAAGADRGAQALCQRL